VTRVGVFGSAFNPPQIGHLILVEEARWQLGLDRVIVVPTGDPYHKETDEMLSGPVRLALAEAAFAGLDRTEVSDLEVVRAGPSRTCETLDEIHSRHPDTEITLLLGADAALGIGSWHRPERILATARIGVASRTGIEPERVERALEAVGGAGRVDFFTMPDVAISSTLVRERIRAERPYRHLVPTAVAAMIENEGLYAV